MNLEEVIAYIRQCREERSQSSYASDRVYMLLDAYDKRGEEIVILKATIARFIDQWPGGDAPK